MARIERWQYFDTVPAAESGRLVEADSLDADPAGPDRSTVGFVLPAEAVHTGSGQV